ncbi:hypothetical protein ACFYYR_15865 [Streptomyces sp. NPDC001922]|uniref:hypothetical protein n=1 Tax=Streptomyces sp. NPDC001922 TaxID=3364624 RepID=UPI003686CCCB
MSLGDDGYGTGYPDDGPGAGRQTRTRLPERAGGDGYDDGRRSRTAARPSKGMITVVGVVVLLIAAIAFANRGGGKEESSGRAGGSDAQPQPTSPTGEKPVTGSQGGIASGFPKTKQGAQSAAANYAVALVSSDILKPDRRPGIIRQLFVSDKVDELDAKFDKAYSKAFLDKLGLDAEGNPEEGMTYVSRTAPVGTRTNDYDNTRAEVDVWCTGAFGTAGVKSTNPVANDWFTMTVDLRWSDGDWKIESFSQQEGPAPVNTDRRASNADEIAKAVKEYGGFTYAR